MDILDKVAGLHDDLARSMLDRTGKGGKVWCYECGASQAVDAAECLRSGWPTCCGETMSIDPPPELPDSGGHAGGRSS